MAKTAQEYWQDRIGERLVSSEKIGAANIPRTLDLYDQALENIQKEVKSIYDNYSKQGILDVKELEKSIGAQGARDFMKKVEVKARKMGLDPKKIYDERYLYRLNRAQALQEQVRLEAMTIAPQEERYATQTYKKILQDGYGNVQSDIEYMGISPSFSTLDGRMTDAILTSVWAGDNYSNRVWKDSEKLALKLPTILGGSFSTGQSYEKTSRQLRDTFDVSRYEAVRLVRTESAYFHNQTEAQSYIDDGIDRYTLDVTYDGRTSKICLEVDESEVFQTDEISVGQNYPPLHPQCRTVPRAILDGETVKPKKDYEDRIERFAAFDDGTLKKRWQEAMQKQMDPNKMNHDYNADMNIISQNLKNKVITSEQFQEQVSTLMDTVPQDYPLRGGLEQAAKLNGWKDIQLTDSQRNIKKQFDEAGWDFKAAKLTPAQTDFLSSSPIKFDNVSAELSIESQGQFNADQNTISIASDRIKTTARVLKEPKLYENVVKHELGHAVDYYAPFLDSKAGDLFSSNIDFQKAIIGKGGDSTISEFNNQAVSIFKHRVAQGMSRDEDKTTVRQLPVQEFRNQLEKAQAVKVGKTYTEVPFDTMTYMLEPKELFAESYSLFHTDPKYLKSEAPDIYNYIDRITKLKL